MSSFLAQWFLEICLLQNYVTTNDFLRNYETACDVTSLLSVHGQTFSQPLVHGTLMRTHYLCLCICIFKVKPRSTYQVQINTPRVEPCIDGSLRSGTLPEQDLCTGCRSSRRASTLPRDLLPVTRLFSPCKQAFGRNSHHHFTTPSGIGRLAELWYEPLKTCLSMEFLLVFSHCFGIFENSFHPTGNSPDQCEDLD